MIIQLISVNVINHAFFISRARKPTLGDELVDIIVLSYAQSEGFIALTSQTRFQRASRLCIYHIAIKGDVINIFVEHS